MNIRKATEKDAKSIVEIIRETVSDTHKNLYSKESIKNILTHYRLEKVLHFIKSYEYFVLEENKTIVGCVLVKEGKMRSLYVLPSYHGRGFGKKLVQVAEVTASEQGYKQIWLWASLVSYDFYLHMGYEFVEDVKDENNRVIDKVMRKKLS